jgi:transcriptional regulator with XRE-family HTH domain
LSERSNLIRRLVENTDTRASYIKAKLGILVPSQIRALRMRSDMPRQSDLAKAAGVHQSRISMFETPGAANMTLETLSRIAAAFKVGLIVKFVSFTEMLREENNYSQDRFCVITIERDRAFIEPTIEQPQPHIEGGAGAANTLGNDQDVSQLDRGASGMTYKYEQPLARGAAAA